MKDDPRKAVAAAVEALRKAMIAADKPALERLATAQLSYGHSSGRVESKAEFVEAFVSGKSGFSSIELEGQTISVTDSIALVRHVFSATHRNHRKGGETAKLYILTVWLKQQDEWKLLARQATRLA